MPVLEEMATDAPADPLRPEPAVISQVVRETSDTFSLRMDMSHRPGGFAFAPGQFNMLYLFGVGEVPISISGDPDRPEELVHTIRAAGTVTRAMEGLRPGAVVGVRGPYGSSWPIEQARGRNVVVVAGGIGLAPLRPVVYHVLHHRPDFGELMLLYGARTPDNLLYVQELLQWRGRGRFDMRVHVTVDRAGGEWRGNVGVVTALFPKIEFDPAETVGLICGPEVMMRFTIREFEKRGLSAEWIYVSMERNMRCGVGLCGHCQYGPSFVCKDGAVYRFAQIAPTFPVREI